MVSTTEYYQLSFYENPLIGRFYTCSLNLSEKTNQFSSTRVSFAINVIAELTRA